MSSAITSLLTKIYNGTAQQTNLKSVERRELYRAQYISTN